MLQTTRISRLCLTALIALILCSCGGGDRILEDSQKIADGSWKADEPVVFSVAISDTGSRYNLYVDIRNDLTYEFSNLYLFLKTTFPNEFFTRDTIECQLAGYDGKWLGSGSGSVRFSRFLFQHAIQFPDTGLYRFEIQQAMREEALRGIRDVGLYIERLHPSTNLNP